MWKELGTGIHRWLWALSFAGSVAALATIAAIRSYVVNLPLWATLWFLSIGLGVTFLLMWRDQYLRAEKMARLFNQLTDGEREEILNLIRLAGEMNEAVGHVKFGATIDVSAPMWDLLRRLQGGMGRYSQWPNILRAVRDFDHFAGYLIIERKERQMTWREYEKELVDLHVRYNTLLAECNSVLGRTNWELYRSQNIPRGVVANNSPAYPLDASGK